MHVKIWLGLGLGLGLVLGSGVGLGCMRTVGNVRARTLTEIKNGDGARWITIFPFLSAVRAHGAFVSVVVDVVSDWTAVWIYDPKLHYAAYGCRNRSTRDKVSFYQ